MSHTSHQELNIVRRGHKEMAKGGKMRNMKTEVAGSPARQRTCTVALSAISALLFAMAVFATLLFPAAARAQSCDAFAANIVSQFGNIPAGQGTMDAHLVSNQSDAVRVMYAEKPAASDATNQACQTAGTCQSRGLKYYPRRHFWGSLYFPPTLSGTLTEFFSDRRFPGDLRGNSYPFSLGPLPPGLNPGDTDDLDVTIYLGNSFLGNTTGQVVFTFRSHGNAGGGFQGLCQDGMLYGFQGNIMYVFSLFNLQLNPPPPPIQ